MQLVLRDHLVVVAVDYVELLLELLAHLVLQPVFVYALVYCVWVGEPLGHVFHGWGCV